MKLDIKNRVQKIRSAIEKVSTRTISLTRKPLMKTGVKLFVSFAVSKGVHTILRPHLKMDLTSKNIFVKVSTWVVSAALYSIVETAVIKKFQEWKEEAINVFEEVMQSVDVVAAGDIPFASKKFAEQTLSSLKKKINKEGFVTVADLYKAVGKTADPKIASKGWDDLSEAHIFQDDDTYMLHLPEARRPKKEKK